MSLSNTNVQKEVFGMRNDCYGVKTIQNERIEHIAISEISDFPEHPFRVVIDKDMMELVESVSRMGVVNPAVVRQGKAGGYEMIVGHRRKAASLIAGEKNASMYSKRFI